MTMFICQNEHTYDRPEQQLCPICGSACAGEFSEVWQKLREREQRASPVEATTVRQRIAKMVAASAKRGGSGQRSLYLRCGNGHIWASAPDPERQWGCDPAECPTCGQVFNDKRIVYGEYDPNVKCTHSCRFAVRSDCICSCGGRYHSSRIETLEIDEQQEV